MNTINNLQDIANDIRKLTLKTVYDAKSGHIGPALSIVDIITVLLFDQMNWHELKSGVKDKTPDEEWQYWQNPELARDRFVLSKGHAVPSWYAALAYDGYIEKEELKTLRVINSRLQGHPERKRFPFVDATTGSLGQGQSEALGYALAKKTQGRDETVYCIIGDGESNEGQVWETALSAPKFKLDNFIVFVDFNNSQGEGKNEEVMNLENLEDKWKSFNWHTQRINGHNIEQIKAAVEVAKNNKNGQPHVIICDTKKGYLKDGEVFMNGAHNAAVDEENYNNAIKLLEQ
jgi:transketolase